MQHMDYRKAAAQAALQATRGEPGMHRLLFTSAWQAVQEHGPPAYQALAAKITQLLKTKKLYVL